MPKQTFFNLPGDKRQAILDIAIEEFAENDYNSASISRVVARAGIAKGSFYQYFEDKKDLYLYLIQLMGEEKQRFFVANPPPESEVGIFDWLRWMFQAGLGFQFSNPRLARIGFRAAYGDAPLPSEFQATVQDSGMAFFRPLVERGMAQGDIDAGLDPELVASILNGVMTELGDYLLRRLGVPPEALLAQGGRALDKPEYGLIVAQVIDILQRGLAAERDS
jgi:TetR/AcrR family transcriptional regulator